jgi:hypothetical protein
MNASPATPIQRLASATGAHWGSIEACIADSARERHAIGSAIQDSKLIPSDCSFIVCGSLARDEYTLGETKNKGSDVDWTLLVDGQADPKHLDVAQGIAKTIKDLGYKDPGPTALFGGLAFSHELVHMIGGEPDTNRNLTRRILLILESRAINPDNGVRDRVMRSILNRYLQEDRGYHQVHNWKVKVPRFLLNDIARFWRTMTVDYAAKRRERAWRGWAIRNFKLRMSRKLIFVSGLAMCLKCELLPPESLKQDINSEVDFHAAMLELLLDFTSRTPLELLAIFATEFGAEEKAAKIFHAYDEFLALLRDPAKRTKLEEMEFEEAISDPVFSDARRIGTDFQTGLTDLFFNTNDALTKATQRYGVF